MENVPAKTDWASLTKKEATAIYKERLLKDNRWALRALVVLGGKQTAYELSNRHTVVQNGEGFNSYDADFLTSLYHQTLNGDALSHGQYAALRRRIAKYAGQLYRYSCCMGFSRQNY